MSVSMESRMERYLISLVADALNQNESAEIKWKPSWEWIYKMSDYHHVANLVYYKVMWSDDARVRKWKERFEERYKSAIRLQERNQILRDQIEQELEKKEIHALFLGESAILRYYERPEMRTPEPLQILVQKKKYDDARRAVVSMGFEEITDRQNQKTGLFVKIPDQRIRLLHELPFSGKKVKMWFKDMPGELPREDGRHYIHYMNEETLYIYFICRLADKFARGQAEIRDVADLWTVVSKEGHGMKWKEVREELESLELETFGEYIVKLAGKWFGNMHFYGDNGLLNAMQTYILSKGAYGRRENESFLPLVPGVVDSYYRDLRKEEKRKMREMQFPSLEYMAVSFPKLKKWPLLLPAYWIIRLAKRRKFTKKEQSKLGKDEDKA